MAIDTSGVSASQFSSMFSDMLSNDQELSQSIQSQGADINDVVSGYTANGGVSPEAGLANLESIYAAGEQHMMKVKMMQAVHDMAMEALRAIKF